MHKQEQTFLLMHIFILLEHSMATLSLLFALLVQKEGIY